MGKNKYKKHIAIFICFNGEAYKVRNANIKEIRRTLVRLRTGDGLKIEGLGTMVVTKMKPKFGQYQNRLLIHTREVEDKC